MQVIMISTMTRSMIVSKNRTITLAVMTWQLLIHRLVFLLKGMEEVKRQFGQHIAVEPEWEAGFSLQIQLRHILTMFQDWCSSEVNSHNPKKTSHTLINEMHLKWRREN